MRFNIAIIFLACCLSIPGVLRAQKADSIITMEIDQQIWYPFIHAFNAFDAEAFNALHTPDVLRGGPWGLRPGDAYLQGNLVEFARNKQAGDTRQIAFTFEYRVHTPEIAYEVGYYRVKRTRGEDNHTFYGQFHVVLKNVNGVWKLAQDWDASELAGEPVSESHFLKFAEKGLLEE